MNPLRKALIDYLGIRRALGYKLQRDEKLLTQFLAYLENLDRGHRIHNWSDVRISKLEHGVEDLHDLLATGDAGLKGKELVDGFTN